MQIILKDSEYAFNAANKTITLQAPYSTLDIGQIISIIDLTTKDLIYASDLRGQPARSSCSETGCPISMAGAVITHTYTNSNHANSDKLQIIIDIQTEAKIPTIYNITMTLADTEYSQALPTNTKKIEFRCRDAFDTRFAYVTGKVAGPATPYRVLLSGEIKSESNLILPSTTLYFACGTASKIMEIEVWV